jgi:hypothetical protein
MKPKKIETSNPLFIMVEGEGMCETGMVDIQQQDSFDDEWKKIRFHYEDIPLLIEALNKKIPEINSKNYDKWDKKTLDRCV